MWTPGLPFGLDLPVLSRFDDTNGLTLLSAWYLLVKIGLVLLHSSPVVHASFHH